MQTFDPFDQPIPLIHQLLLSGVAPRPIALVSTIDATGNGNLSPFSFFNAFGANPPVVVVSPAFAGKTGKPKHTFENIIATKEFTISAVSYAMLHQINLASAEYDRGIDEFVQAGFTRRESMKVQPAGVAEAPFTMECRLLQYVDTGSKPGSGNLLIGEVVMFHVKDEMFTEGKIDPYKLDLVARMGYNWYCHANGEALFELPKPAHIGIGFDKLPQYLRMSTILTGNDLARLASVAILPDAEEIRVKWKSRLRGRKQKAIDMESVPTQVQMLPPWEATNTSLLYFQSGKMSALECSALLQQQAQRFLVSGDTESAWECALLSDPESIHLFSEYA